MRCMPRRTSVPIEEFHRLGKFTSCKAKLLTQGWSLSWLLANGLVVSPHIYKLSAELCVGIPGRRGWG